MLHNEGLDDAQLHHYNFQVLRDDIYMLGVDGTVTGNRIAPVRSSCAVLVSSQNANRDWLYYQQQTVSAEGFSGQAFSTFVSAHRAREGDQALHRLPRLARERQQRLDGAAAAAGHQLRELHGPLRLRRRRATSGFEAVAVAEHDEPPAVYRQRPAEARLSGRLQEAFVAAPPRTRRSRSSRRQRPRRAGCAANISTRRMGKGGFRVFDIANIDNKDFSERMVTAPVSPLGQRFYVTTKYATAVASPTTLGVDPLRTASPENEEQPIHLMYGFLYVADKDEGLVVVGDPESEEQEPGRGHAARRQPRTTS